MEVLVPLLVLVDNAVVGLAAVFHTTPRVVLAPPALVTLPPLMAEFVVISVVTISMVVTTGAVAATTTVPLNVKSFILNVPVEPDAFQP